MSKKSPFNLPNYINNNELFLKFSQQLRGLTRTYKVIQIVTGVILPIIEGFLVSKATAESSQFWIFVILLIFIGVLHLSLVIIILSTEHPLPQFILDFDQQAQKLSDTEDISIVQELFVNTFRNTVEATSLSLLGIENAVKNKTVNLEEVFSLILDPWIKNRTDIFWFSQGNAMYNIAVYLLNEQHELEVKFRQCDDRINQRNRKWQPGVGHVGQCYARRTTSFGQDTAKELQTTNTETERPEDHVYYRSVIAEPIKVCDNIIGVLVITSSQAEQFQKDIHVPCIRVIAQLLGLGYEKTQGVNADETPDIATK